MSIFESIFSPKMQGADTRYRQVNLAGSSIASLFTGGKSSAGVTVTHDSAITIPAVYSAVSVISDILAMLPVHVLENKNGQRGRPSDHPAAHLLNVRANPHQAPFIVKTRHFAHALTHGNGYIEVARNGRGEAQELWGLLPDRTHPEKLPEGELFYRTNVNGEQFRIGHKNIIHTKAFGQDGYIGLSPVALHREALGLSLATQEFGSKFFGNDAKSGGFLQHPGKLGDAAKKNLTESVNRSSGLDEAHRIRVLEEGMKYVTTSIPPDDAQFLGTREFQIEEVARIYRIPPVLLQSLSKTTSWGSGIEQMMIFFVTFTLQPWVTQFEQLLSATLLSEQERERGLYIKINVNALMRGDMAARKEFYKAAITDGWLSREEVREFEDMPYAPGLDKFLRPMNMTDGTDGSEDDAV